MECLGDSFSYCANPTGAKTDWCPTQLNADGSYTSDLPFSWCEAEVSRTRDFSASCVPEKTTKTKCRLNSGTPCNTNTHTITLCRCSRRARRPSRVTRWPAPALLTGSIGARTTASVPTPTTGASSGAPRRRMRWVVGSRVLFIFQY